MDNVQILYGRFCNRGMTVNGSAVCWINHKTTPFDNLYRGMEKESQKISSERRRNRRDRKSAQAKIRALEVSTRDRGGSLRVRRRNKQYSSEPCPDQVTSTTNGRPNRTNQLVLISLPLTRLGKLTAVVSAQWAGAWRIGIFS